VPKGDGALHGEPLVALLARQAPPRPRRLPLRGRGRDRGPGGLGQAVPGRPRRGGAALRLCRPSPGGRHGHGADTGRLGPIRAPAAGQAV
ncbi:MAG: hypothetical protein AVDCRST_MAG25-1768, partial [uncultured Rubrobacteraceae bacterium]